MYFGPFCKVGVVYVLLALVSYLGVYKSQGPLVWT